MKSNYKVNVTLKCTTCGETDFEFNDDKTFVKCNNCGRDYPGGYDELTEYNQEQISDAVDHMKDDITQDLEMEFNNMLKKAFKGSKYIKIK